MFISKNKKSNGKYYLYFRNGTVEIYKNTIKSYNRIISDKHLNEITSQNIEYDLPPIFSTHRRA